VARSQSDGFRGRGWRQAAAPLTRAQVAKQLGVSISSVRRMEGRELHPKRLPDGTHVFAEDEIAALVASRPAPPPPPLSEGELAAKLFAMFASGKELRDIVIELKIPPRTVRELFAQWNTELRTGMTMDGRRQAARRDEVETREYLKQSERAQKEFEKTMAELVRQASQP
jgi:hypothetical protein